MGLAVHCGPMGELWTCPNCGHKFRWRNQWHSCTKVTLEDHLRGKPAEVVALYRAFEQAVLGLGDDVEIEAVKGRVEFRARIRFAGCTIQRKGLRCAVLLPRVLPHPRFVRIESPMPTQHPHYFRIDGPEDLDGEVRAWLEEAYALGSG